MRSAMKFMCLPERPWLHSMPARLVLAAAIAVAAAGPAGADGKCVLQTGELAGVEGLPKVEQQVCSIADGGASGSIAITFLRLDEALAGNVAMRERTPELEHLLGEPKVVENEVFSALAPLFQKFAQPTMFPADSVKLTLTVGTPRDDLAYSDTSVGVPAVAKSAGDRKIWSISSTFGNSLHEAQLASFPIDMPDEERVLYNSNVWPKAFRQTFACVEDPIKCTRLWRTVDLTELAGIEKRQKTEPQEEAVSSLEPQAGAQPVNVPKTHFNFFRFLGKNAWPADFLIFEGGNLTSERECTGYIDFGYYFPDLALDVALIENRLQKAVRIADLIGDSEAKTALRPAAANAESARDKSIGSVEGEIAPGGKLLLPLRVVFHRDVDFSGEAKLASAKRVYEQIMSQPRGTLSRVDFYFDGKRKEGARSHISKVREAFMPPSVPSPKDYLYGPAAKLTALQTGSGRIELALDRPNTMRIKNGEYYPDQPSDVSAPGEDEQPSNAPSLQLKFRTTFDEANSCPILYSWDSQGKYWLNHGKVIHTAHGSQNEATSVVSVSPKARRFRLAEEEPETAFIRQVNLRLFFRDGREITLSPRQIPSSEIQTRIRPYSSAEANFEVPAEYALADIVRAELAVTGYYVRNSDMLADAP
jgi:hypothetical protein